MFIAPDLASFKADFAAALKNMLTPDGLGAFILVLANSMQDEELRSLLKEDLDRTFAQLLEKNPDGPVDDRSVFAALAETGIDGLGCWETCQQGAWELVINPLRTLRPARASGEVFSEIQRPFDPARFHFNKPFLKPEILWDELWQGGQLRVLYNKFPFAPWHLLVVPEPQQTLPQFLTYKHHARIMELVTEQVNALSGLGMAFNSLGAYASINQLHFQGFVRESALPLESFHWLHNGGQTPYPFTCFRTTTAQEAWEIIDDCHVRNQPYNLLYRENVCYVLPRVGQGLVALPEWAQGIGWHETCGIFTIPESAALDFYTVDRIQQTLAKLTVS